MKFSQAKVALGVAALTLAPLALFAWRRTIKPVAGFFVGQGPCLFTEAHCGTTVHFARQEDGSLKMQLHPIALTRFEDGHREPFVVYLSGTCQAKDNDR